MVEVFFLFLICQDSRKHFKTPHESTISALFFDFRVVVRAERTQQNMYIFNLYIVHAGYSSYTYIYILYKFTPPYHQIPLRAS